MDLEDCTTTKSQQHSCLCRVTLSLHQPPTETGQQEETEKAKQQWEKYVRGFSESYKIPALGFEKGK